MVSPVFCSQHFHTFNVYRTGALGYISVRVILYEQYYVCWLMVETHIYPNNIILYDDNIGVIV